MTAQAFAAVAQEIAAAVFRLTLPRIGAAMIVGCSANFLWPKIVRRLGRAVEQGRPLTPGASPMTSLSEVGAWLQAASPLLTTVAGGVLAIVAAVLLSLIVTALGPDVQVFTCMDSRARFFAYLTSFAWFARGVLVLTSLPGPEPRRAHWDMPVSSAMTTILLAYSLAWIWKQRLPRLVRERFDRRQAFKDKRVRKLIADGEIERAAAVAEGADPDGSQLYALGMAPDALDHARDPWADRLGS